MSPLLNHLTALRAIPTGNPMIQGGAGLMLLGAAGQWAKQGPRKLWEWGTRGLWLTCKITSDDESFFWVMRWMALHLDDRRSSSYRVESRWEDDEDGGHSRTTTLVPGPSQRVVTFQGVKFWVVFGEHGEGTKLSRSATIRCRRRHRAVLYRLMDDITELEKRPDPTVTKIMRPQHGRWKRHASRPVRAADSIIMDGVSYETMYADMKKFDESYDWYLSLGIPYRRGYLLYGPPGNGKSSLSFALAGALGRDLYVLPMGDPSMDDERLVELMGTVPSHSLVVMEDFDTVFNGREREADNKLTLSGVLNVLDGPLATEGRLVVLTANHPEVLDPALVRAGRVDVRVELRNATEDQARRLFARFYPDASAADQAGFSAWAGDGSHSMASLQAHLVTTLGDRAAALTPRIAPTATVECSA